MARAAHARVCAYIRYESLKLTKGLIGVVTPNVRTLEVVAFGWTVLIADGRLERACRNVGPPKEGIWDDIESRH